MHEKFMSRALELASAAFAEGEVPVGCVIVHDGKIIAEGRNKRECERNALLHAEIIAIDKACAELKSWRLEQCALYVTLEPCPMCAGAIISSRIGTVVYGASDQKMGACGGVINLFEEAFNHRPRLYGGVLEKQCSEIMADFFKNLRI